MKKKKPKQSATNQRRGFLSLKSVLPFGNDTSLKIQFRVYDDISKLPLDLFIDALVDHNLEALKIEGPCTPERLQEAWEKIYVQVAEITSKGQNNTAFELWKEIDQLRGKIYLANGCIEHLQVEFVQDLVNILNAFALDCTLMEEDRGLVLERKLNAVVGRAKKWEIKLRQKQKELENHRQENTGKMDRPFFDDMLDAITKYTKVYTVANQITVSRFFRILNKMDDDAKRAEIEALKKSRK